MDFIWKICFVLISYVLLSLDAAKFRCDYTFSGCGWHKYYEIPAMFYDARLRCHLQDAILASPTTQEIKDAMLGSVKNIPMFTGLHATNTNGEYYSVDGVPLVIMPHQWADLEPNNLDNTERCIAMDSKGKFGDVRCDQARPYMCYRENSKNDTTICGTPDTEYFYDARTSKCYKFHKIPRKYERAEFACAAEGGHLVIINSEEEAQVVRELYARYPDTTMVGNFPKDYAYIGLYDWDKTRDWMTIHGQTLKEAGYSTFASDEPNNLTTGEYCGSVFRNGQLGDTWCIHYIPFICEKKPDYPPVCDSESFLKVKLTEN